MALAGENLKLKSYITYCRLEYRRGHESVSEVERKQNQSNQFFRWFPFSYILFLNNKWEQGATLDVTLEELRRLRCMQKLSAKMTARQMAAAFF